LQASDEYYQPRRGEWDCTPLAKSDICDYLVVVVDDVVVIVVIVVVVVVLPTLYRVHCLSNQESSVADEERRRPL